MVLGYLFVVHLIGSGLVSLYVNLVPSARKVLKDKGLETLTFSVFTTMGNALYPPFLLFMIWVLKKTTKREEFRYILMNYGDMGYGHLLSGPHALLLAMIVFGFILIQFILFDRPQTE